MDQFKPTGIEIRNKDNFDSRRNYVTLNDDRLDIAIVDGNSDIVLWSTDLASDEMAVVCNYPTDSNRILWDMLLKRMKKAGFDINSLIFETDVISTFSDEDPEADIDGGHIGRDGFYHFDYNPYIDD